MTKQVLLIAAAAGLAGVAPLAISVPALAQSSAAGEIIVYGNDPCPRAADDEVLICVRRPETERYRIPPTLRVSGPPQVRDSWVNKSKSLMTAGNTGPNSCSAVGPGGHTGCLAQEIDENVAANKQAQEEGTPPDL